MLTIPPDKLAYIITKAREFDVEVPPVDEQSGSNPSDDPEGDNSALSPSVADPDQLNSNATAFCLVRNQAAG
jgi:hypothetical protein